MQAINNTGKEDEMQVITDTREQLPLFVKNTTRRRLHEGDYNLEGLEQYVVLERKSPGDLYGSLLQGHDRFKREIVRALIKKKTFYILVECPEDFYYSNLWSERSLGCREIVMRRIIHTITSRYKVNFVWCNDRDDMKEKIKRILKEFYKSVYGKDITIISS